MPRSSISRKRRDRDDSRPFVMTVAERRHQEKRLQPIIDRLWKAGVLNTTTLLVPLGRASDPEAGGRPLSLAASLPPCLTVSTGESSEVTL